MSYVKLGELDESGVPFGVAHGLKSKQRRKFSGTESTAGMFSIRRLRVFSHPNGQMLCVTKLKPYDQQEFILATFTPRTADRAQKLQLLFNENVYLA